MEASAFARLYPEQYYDKFLAEGARPDGRPLGRARPVSVARGVVTTADGSALAKVGRTTCLAAVKLEPSPPALDAPALGILDVSVEMPPMCSAATRPGRPSEEAAHCTRRVAEALADARVVALDDLCIAEATWVWRASLDVYVLDHDGAIVDAALIAAVAALRDCVVPHVAVDERGKLVYSGEGATTRGGSRIGGVEEGGEDATASRSSARALKLGAVTPLALTIGQYRDALVVDPTASEEALMESVACVIVGEDGGVVGVGKPGGVVEATESTLMKCVAAAKLRYPKAKAAMDEAFGG
jgi:exosome complex component RRP43